MMGGGSPMSMLSGANDPAGAGNGGNNNFAYGGSPLGMFGNLLGMFGNAGMFGNNTGTAGYFAPPPMQAQAPLPAAMPVTQTPPQAAAAPTSFMSLMGQNDTAGPYPFG